MDTDHHRYFYNNIFSQAISTSGKYLFAGSRYGDIFVQNLEQMENDPQTKYKPKIFPQGDKQILSLSYHRDFLIVGTTGIVYGLAWDEELEELSHERQWRVRIPLADDAFEATDVNYMWLCKETDMLYAGCSDNVIYQINLEDGKIKREYHGHTDYIHSVTGNAEGNIYSASEDGTVLSWSEKEKNYINRITPSSKEDIARDSFGSWIGDVKINNDWLLCGGGPQLSIWHLKYMDAMQIFKYPGSIHVCDFVEDDVIVAGEYESANLFKMSGELVADIPVDNTATFSLVWQLAPIKFMSLAGYSNKLHILKDFRFIDTKLELYHHPCQSDDEDDIPDSSSEDESEKSSSSSS